MPRMLPRLLLGLLPITVAVACVTINVYFPEERVKELSEQIEDAVQQKAAEAEATAGEEMAPAEPPSASAALSPTGWLLHLLPAGEALAQGDVAAPEITNPAIRAIVQSRAQRLPQLQPFKASGVVGENNQALVEVRQLDSLDLKQRAEVQRLVKAENADRERMFQEIAAATGVDAAQLPKIRSTYAETLRQNAAGGEWIQMPDGSWKQK